MVDARPVLLTVSGTIPADVDEQIASGKRPRADYRELAAAFDADIVDVERATTGLGRIGQILARPLGPDISIAWSCFRARRRYEVVVTDGEQVGLPLAALLSLVPRSRRPRHMMIVHIMSVPKKHRLFQALRLGRTIDEFVVYSSAQREFLIERLGVASNRITLTPFMVDTAFFSPAEVSQPERDPDLAEPLSICSAGLELRDYPTLLAAVEGLDAHVVIAAASPWSKRSDQLQGAAIPANIDVVRLDHDRLRDLYASSTIVVMPLHETAFQAGVTTLLEAMAMGKPVVCSATTGQTDVITAGVTGIYVPVADPTALRDAIDGLVRDPELAARLGTAARRWAVANADIEIYCARLSGRVRSLRNGG